MPNIIMSCMTTSVCFDCAGRSCCDWVRYTGLLWRINAGEVSPHVTGHLKNLGVALSQNDIRAATAIQVLLSTICSVQAHVSLYLCGDCTGNNSVSHLNLQLLSHTGVRLLCHLRLQVCDSSKMHTPQSPVALQQNC